MSAVAHAVSYEVGPYGESLTGIGVVYRVTADYGKCGCGEAKMKQTVAYFPDRTDAILYVRRMNQEYQNGR